MQHLFRKSVTRVTPGYHKLCVLKTGQLHLWHLKSVCITRCRLQLIQELLVQTTQVTEIIGDSKDKKINTMKGKRVNLSFWERASEWCSFLNARTFWQALINILHPSVFLSVKVRETWKTWTRVSEYPLRPVCLCLSFPLHTEWRQHVSL